MATRELSITYGAITIGGVSADYLLDGFSRHLIADGVSDSFLEFEAVVVSSTSAGLASLCRSLEEAFRKPRQALTVVQSGQQLLRVAHDDATGGFNTEPEIRKVGDVGDSGRSRRYTIRVKWETPADLNTTSGLRESSVNVAYDAARIRTVTFSGVFTGVPSETSARDRYEAAIAAHAAAILTGLGITTNELVGEPTTEQDYDDKVLRFERNYREIIFGQGVDTPTDDADVVDHRLEIGRREFSEERSPNTAIGGGVTTGGGAIAGTSGTGGGSSGSVVEASTVQALAVFDLHFECHIDATRTTDLKAKYDALRSWLVGQFSAAFGQGTFALTQETPRFDRVGNRIVVDLTAEGSVRGASLVRRTVSSETRETSGIILRGAHTGDPLDHYAYQGFGVKLKITTASARHLNTQDPDQVKAQNEAFAESNAGGFGGSGGGLRIEKSSTVTPVRIGIEGSGHLLNMMDVTSVVTMRQVNILNGGNRGQDLLGGNRNVVRFGAAAAQSGIVRG